MIQPLKVEKFADSYEAVVGSTLTYSIVITNTTGVMLTTLEVKDLLSPGLKFIQGSVEVDGFALGTADIQVGVSLGMLGIGAQRIVVFKTIIVSEKAQTIANQGMVNFTYIDPQDNLSKTGNQPSTSINVRVEVTDVAITQMVDRDGAILGEYVNYRAIVENIGTLAVTNILYKDHLPRNLELVEGSFKVNGKLMTPVNLDLGVNIGDLGVGKQFVVDYQVKVVGGSSSGYIINDVEAIYRYILPNGASGFKKSNKSEVAIKCNVTAFTQITTDKHFKIPCQKPDMEEVDDVAVDIIIQDSYIVETMTGVSNEGQNLSKYKLIVHGYLKISIEYTALLPTQPMHSAHNNMPFSTYIILPMDYDGGQIETIAVLEDVDVDMVNRRGLNVGIVFMVIAQTK